MRLRINIGKVAIFPWPGSKVRSNVYVGRWDEHSLIWMNNEHSSNRIGFQSTSHAWLDSFCYGISMIDIS